MVEEGSGRDGLLISLGLMFDKGRMMVISAICGWDVMHNGHLDCSVVSEEMSHQGKKSIGGDQPC